eukprot:9388023-Karenia_brevis.AAC.1
MAAMKAAQQTGFEKSASMIAGLGSNNVGRFDGANKNATGRTNGANGENNNRDDLVDGMAGV